MCPGPGAVPAATPGSGLPDRVSNLRPNVLGMDLRSRAGWGSGCSVHIEAQAAGSFAKQSGAEGSSPRQNLLPSGVLQRGWH